MEYKEFKTWINAHHQKFMLAGCFVLVFLGGFGIGNFDKSQKDNPKTQINYTKNKTNLQNQPKQGTAEADAFDTATNTPPSKLISDTMASQVQSPGGKPACKIKGNISSGGKKIYHLPSGALYKIVKPEMCFATEKEAQDAGFIKSGR